MKKILVTSALPYANGPIHLGHLLEVIQTDVFARFQRLSGNKVVYVCADDTHGTPIEINARKQGIAPEELIARVGKSHRQDFADFGIDFTVYGSTNSLANRDAAEDVFARLQKAGHIVKRQMELTYCENDQRPLPDRYVTGTCPRCGAKNQYGDTCEICKAAYGPIELKDAKCVLCGKPPVQRTAEHYFVVLEHFRPLLEQIASGESEPKLDTQVQNHLKGWLAKPLKDWCVTRDGPYFGFPVPGEANKFFYVWLDAPVGYISNTPEEWFGAWRYARAQGNDTEIWHFIGKDIIYFHTLFWPAVLSGVGFRLPHRIVVHGMLNVRGEKMSKSKGWLRSAREYLEIPGLVPEHLRYYYASNLTAQPDDIDFNVEDFRNRVNADLVNNLANFCHRTLCMLRARFSGRTTTPTEHACWAPFVEALQQATRDYEALDFRRAVSKIVEAGNIGNGFLQERKPWAVSDEAAHPDLSLAANMAYRIAVLLSPVTPGISGEILHQLGCASRVPTKMDLEAALPPTPRQFDQLREERALVPRINEASVVALAQN